MADSQQKNTVGEQDISAALGDPFAALARALRGETLGGEAACATLWGIPVVRTAEEGGDSTPDDPDDSDDPTPDDPDDANSDDSDDTDELDNSGNAETDDLIPGETKEETPAADSGYKYNHNSKGAGTINNLGSWTINGIGAATVNGVGSATWNSFALSGSIASLSLNGVQCSLTLATLSFGVWFCSGFFSVTTTGAAKANANAVQQTLRGLNSDLHGMNAIVETMRANTNVIRTVVASTVANVDALGQHTGVAMHW